MIALNVNGETRQVDAEGDTPLLYVLRNDLALNAAKFGCGLGQCGACTVLLDGKPIFSCVVPISMLATREDHDARGSPASRTRRGRCTRLHRASRRRRRLLHSRHDDARPGLLETNKNPSDAEIRHHICSPILPLRHACASSPR